MGPCLHGQNSQSMQPLQPVCNRAVLVALLLCCTSIQLACVQAQWTLLAYMLADNNLECDGMADLEEMASGVAAATGGAMDVYVNVDRRTGTCAGQDGSSLPRTSWTSDRDLVMTPGGAWSVENDYGEVNQASSGALSRFVRRGLARFPPSSTRKYMFLLWDHGANFQGLGEDTSCDAATTAAIVAAGANGGSAPMRMCGWLVLPSIVAGLQDALEASGLVRFDLLAIDACIMGNWEVAATLGPVTNYILFSEHLVPANGLDYSALTYVASTPSASAPDVAAAFADKYLPSCAAALGLDCSLTLVDTGASGLVVLASAALRALRAARDFDAVVDLGDLLNLLAEQLNAQPASARISSRLTEVAAARVAYTAALPMYRAYNAGKASGMTIYWPRATAGMAALEPFLGPLGTTTAAIAAWTSLVDTAVASAAQAVLPYAAATAAAQPLTASATWSPNPTSPTPSGQSPSILTLMGDAPAPVLVDGELLAGLVSGPAWGTDSGAGMVILATAPGTVSAARTRLSASWDGGVFGLEQELTGSWGGSVTAGAPVYTEVTEDAGGRTLRMSVMWAPSCSSPLTLHRAASLILRTSAANLSAAPTLSLYASASPGSFGAYGQAASTVPLSVSYLNLGRVDSSEPVTSADLGSLYFINDTLSEYLGMTGSDELYQAWVQSTTTVARGMTPAWTDASRVSQHRRLSQWRQQRRLAGTQDPSQPSQHDEMLAWALESAQKARAAVARAYLAAGVQTDSATPIRGVASLSQGFMGSATAVSEVNPNQGGVIIPLYFTTYRTPGSLVVGTTPGGLLLYGRTFGSSTCFKWGYSTNLTLVKDTLAGWSSHQGGIFADGQQSWAARLVGMDVAGQLVHFDNVHAGGAGVAPGAHSPTSPPTATKAGFVTGYRTTLAGCTCMSQWYKSGTMYRGCATATGWAAPGCEVVAGSCPTNAPALEFGTSYDACAPLNTLSGCTCLPNTWTTAAGSAVAGGACAPPDSTHLGGSWCKVNTTTCPSTLRSHKDAGADWDYCGVATASGCVCVNSWRDAAGKQYSGTCATLPMDPLSPSRGILSWCPTVREVGFFTPPVGQTGAGAPSAAAACPVAWDTCTPAGGRAAVRNDTAATVATCELPSSLPFNSTPSFTAFDCVAFDPDRPGVTLSEWCYVNTTSPSGARQQALCLARGCAPRLRAVCPPRTNDTLGITACFEQVCAARVRGGVFNTNLCPGEAQAALDAGQTVYKAVHDAMVSASDSRNPWLVALNGSTTQAATAAYCTATYGLACRSTLQQVCSSLVAVPVGSPPAAGLDAFGIGCSVGCLIAACKVQRALEASGRHGAAPSSGCADAHDVAPLLPRIFSYYDLACGTEPSRLLCAQFEAVEAHNNVRCPSLLGDDSLLGAAAGLFGPTTPAIGYTNDTSSQADLEARVAASLTAVRAAHAANNTDQYGAYAACYWQIMPNDPKATYIKLQLEAIQTEALYDAVTVWDAQGLVVTLSGAPDAVPEAPSPALPGEKSVTVTTDTGYMLVKFQSDVSLQANLGFLASYTTSPNTFQSTPSCSATQRLVTLHLSLLDSGPRASWAIARGVLPAPTDISSLTFVAAGGVLPLAANGALSAWAAASWAGAMRATPGAGRAVGVGVSFAHASFPNASPALLPAQREVSVGVCLEPGSYTLARFDRTGAGAWVRGSAAVSLKSSTTTTALLAPEAASINADVATLVYSSGSASVQVVPHDTEVTDTFVVPGGSGAGDALAERQQGSESWSYTLDLFTSSGLIAADFGVARIGTLLRLAAAQQARVSLPSLTISNATDVRKDHGPYAPLPPPPSLPPPPRAASTTTTRRQAGEMSVGQLTAATAAGGHKFSKNVLAFRLLARSVAADEARAATQVVHPRASGQGQSLPSTAAAAHAPANSMDCVHKAQGRQGTGALLYLPHPLSDTMTRTSWDTAHTAGLDSLAPLAGLDRTMAGALRDLAERAQAQLRGRTADSGHHEGSDIDETDIQNAPLRKTAASYVGTYPKAGVAGAIVHISGAAPQVDEPTTADAAAGAATPARQLQAATTSIPWVRITLIGSGFWTRDDAHAAQLALDTAVRNGHLVAQLQSYGFTGLTGAEALTVVDDGSSSGWPKGKLVAVAVGASVGGLLTLMCLVGVLFYWRVLQSKRVAPQGEQPVGTQEFPPPSVAQPRVVDDPSKVLVAGPDPAGVAQVRASAEVRRSVSGQS